MTTKTSTNLYDVARKKADNRFIIGKNQKDAILDRVATTVIRDKLVAPAAMTFIPSHKIPSLHPEVVSDSELLLQYGQREVLKVHRHALGQLAGKVELPMNFVNRLRSSKDDWRMSLLAHNFNELFHNWTFVGDNPRFLHRIVNDELRGFLTRRFNRHLASLPMLRAFIEAYEKAGAQPTESMGNDVRVSLKAFLPQVFEAYEGQYICVGVEWSNSDFGAGKLCIAQTIWDPMRDTRAVMDEPISRIHLGSVIEESDIEMSDETMAKEVEVQAAAIHDAVKQYLSGEHIDRMVRAVKVAHEEEIPLSKLKGLWRGILLKKELESVETFLSSSDVVDLPAPGRNMHGDPLPTRWWAAAVISHLADKCDDEARRAELQREAGRMVSEAKKEE
jgi:hypothetical protein